MTATDPVNTQECMQILPYSEQNHLEWDALVARAPMATMLHTRRYLTYHGSRFKDVSAIVKDNQEMIIGIFPAAMDPSEGGRVVSHPGITYGGMLHDGRLRGSKMIEALQLLTEHYNAEGHRALRYKAVPQIYHRSPSEDDIYALFRIGAICYRTDLSSAINLAEQPALSSRRKRALKKARSCGITINEGSDHIGGLWEVLEENLERKHGVKPVHSSGEITYLHSLFPEGISFVVAQLGSQTVAGVVLFCSPRVVHAQYIASSLKGYETCALDAVFDYCISKAKTRGAQYFDFGVSTEQEGRRLNDNLYQFKSEFGTGGVIHQFFEIDLPLRGLDGH